MKIFLIAPFHLLLAILLWQPGTGALIANSFESTDTQIRNILQDQRGFVSSQGVDIWYQTFGTGSPLLIINGGPGMSSEGFIPLAGELSRDRQTILFDQRGTGRSVMEQPSPENVTLDLMVEDMEAIRKHLEIDRWTVMGHSFGGMLAAFYAAKHPDRVNGLIFSSSGGLDMELFSYLNITSRLTQQQNDSLQYWNKRIDDGDTSYQALIGRGRALAPAYLYHKKHVPVIAERLTQGNMTINGLVFANMRSIDFDTKDDLRSYSSPILIIQGADDIIDEVTARRTQQVLPQARVVLLEECGHYGWLDQKKRYFREIRSFLTVINESLE